MQICQNNIIFLYFENAKNWSYVTISQIIIMSTTTVIKLQCIPKSCHKKSLVYQISQKAFSLFTLIDLYHCKKLAITAISVNYSSCTKFCVMKSLFSLIK